MRIKWTVPPVVPWSDSWRATINSGKLWVGRCESVDGNKAYQLRVECEGAAIFHVKPFLSPRAAKLYAHKLLKLIGRMNDGDT